MSLLDHGTNLDALTKPVSFLDDARRSSKFQRPSSERLSLLMVAAKSGCNEYVKGLLSSRASIGAKSNEGHACMTDMFGEDVSCMTSHITALGLFLSGEASGIGRKGQGSVMIDALRDGGGVIHMDSTAVDLIATMPCFAGSRANMILKILSSLPAYSQLTEIEAEEREYFEMGIEDVQVFGNEAGVSAGGVTRRMGTGERGGGAKDRKLLRTITNNLPLVASLLVSSLILPLFTIRYAHRRAQKILQNFIHQQPLMEGIG